MKVKIFDKETFDAMLTTAIPLRANINKTAFENIWKKIRDYNRRHHVPNKIKVDQKILLKNQRRMDRKSVKFSFKRFGPFTVHLMSKKNLCSLINKDGNLNKTKYNVFLLKPYLNPDETKVTCDENHPPTATNEQPHVEKRYTSPTYSH